MSLRDLDAAYAEKVVGLTVERKNDRLERHVGGGFFDELLYYSADLNALLPELRKYSYEILHRHDDKEKLLYEYAVVLWLDGKNEPRRIHLFAKTAPLAATKVLLIANGMSREDVDMLEAK